MAIYRLCKPILVDKALEITDNKLLLTCQREVKTCNLQLVSYKWPVWPKMSALILAMAKYSNHLNDGNWQRLIVVVFEDEIVL